MRDLVRHLASLKLALGLLGVIVIAMAAATILESTRGTETALRYVYLSVWFRGLLFLFGLNVACSLVDAWPWGWRRAGFAMTHGSMLLVLVGALVTDTMKIEGRLALWEGEQSSRFSTASGGPAPATLDLPFSVRLESFEIDYYPGTRRPAMFRSRVIVEDPELAAPFPAVIEMNRELSHAGYRLFQSSYEQTPERDKSILTVSKDPGQPIVFAGYTLMMLGMLTVLGTRMAERRAADHLRASLMSKRSRAAAIAAGMGLAASLAGVGPVLAAALPDAPPTEALRALPIQHDGRVMPLDTLAREATWQVTGRRAYDGIDPVRLVLGWSFDPEGWAGERIIPLGPAMAAHLGIEGRDPRASFFGLTGNPRAMALLQEARDVEARGGRLSGALSEAHALEERLVWMQRFLQRTIIRPIPSGGGPEAAWETPAALQKPDDLLALASSPAVPAETRARAESEVTYNRLRPSRLAWWILLPATAISIFTWTRPRRWLDVLSLLGLLAGFAVMTWGITARWQAAGRIPASNMYESLLFLGWGVGLFALIALIFLRSRLVVVNATAMATLTMALTDLLPIDPFIHPMPPVLSGTPWLAIHVPIIMVSYSVLALGVVVAHMQIGLGIFAPRRRELIDRMSDLLYWYIHIGAILLIAGILTGSIWAASSWGRYWGWDPKEVWSLIAFLVYLGILHGRLERFIGPFGVAALSIIGFWTILMTYIGVNFVLTAGLHSYGFGGSGVVRWMAIVAMGEVLFLTAAWFTRASSATAS